ncbi:isoflavone reductase family protein [Stachybotrys elegans]|uniref:Isoflavone reductase family protein n=1 Tax=Stachybotrys elegans TaxID=80388 RepID=A0A8K0SXZ1_9HYPO|nr:isoflavone reductase family protein [Stachybotrys elegans]
MMRIAVAGGGGLGRLLAMELAQADNAYNVIVLSRSVRQEYASEDIGAFQVDYSDYENLMFHLQGIDLVISTISGSEQISLIDAAGASGVRFFVPSEFEGTLSHRPQRNDPLDRGSAQARARLGQWSATMKYTVFSCGIFMERFSRYGLGYYEMGYGSGVPNAGDYLINRNNNTASITDTNSAGHLVHICLTSAHDLARAVTAAVALDPHTWPREWSVRGDRRSLRDLVALCSRASGQQYDRHDYSHADLQTNIDHFAHYGDTETMAYLQRLKATADGRYDFSTASLNNRLGNRFRFTSFREWLQLNP